MSEVKVNKVSPRTGTELELGDSGDTIKTSGSLDTNNNNIITASNRDLNLYPNGTGAVEIGGNTNPGTIILNCESNSHGIKLQSPAHSAGQSYTLKFPTGNVTADRFLKVASITGSGATGVGQLSFAEAGGGAMTFLSATSVTSASSVTVGTFSATYTSYKIIIAGISPATTNQDLYFTFIKSDGSEETAANYRYTVGGFRESTSGTEGTGSASNAKWGRNAHNDTGTVNADILITNPQQSIRTSVIGTTNKRFVNDAYSYAELFGCWMNPSTSYTQIKFFPASGNWNASGKIMVYGLKES